MNTYFEGGIDIEWYCQFLEHVETAWINFSKQIIFNDKVHKVSDFSYSEFQADRILENHGNQVSSA